MNQKKADYQWAWHCARAIKNLASRDPYSLQVSDIVRMSLELHETGFADVVTRQLSSRDYFGPRAEVSKARRYGWYQARIDYKRASQKEVTHER